MKKAPICSSIVYLVRQSNEHEAFSGPNVQKIDRNPGISLLVRHNTELLVSVLDKVLLKVHRLLLHELETRARIGSVASQDIVRVHDRLLTGASTQNR